jgi:hypothetical protein
MRGGELVEGAKHPGVAGIPLQLGSHRSTWLIHEE